MRRSRDFHAAAGRAWQDRYPSRLALAAEARRRGLAATACAMFAAVVTTAAPSHADETTPTAHDILGRAKDTWDKGAFDRSEPLYKEALERGGLSPSETLDSYIHVGAARAVLGRRTDALAAFRKAALLDPRFAVPSEAGKRAAHLANQARREQAKIGPLQIRAEVPESVPANKPFKVAATVDPAHVALISKLGIVASEPEDDMHSEKKGFETSEPAAPSVAWDVPATVAAPSAVLSVRIDALDPHDNRLVTVEKVVHVEAMPAEAPPAPIAATANGSHWAKPVAPEKKKDPEDAKKGGGFWASPWPYVIGGVALAAGGAAVYFGTRPADDVTVGATSVRVR